MIHACLPQQSKESIDLLFGADPNNSSVELVRTEKIPVRDGVSMCTV